MGCAVAESLPSRPPGKGEAPVLLEEGGLDCAPNADAVPALKRGIGAGGSALDVTELCICMTDNIASDFITNRRPFQKNIKFVIWTLQQVSFACHLSRHMHRTGRRILDAAADNGRHLSAPLSGALFALPAAHDWETKDGLQCSGLSCSHLRTEICLSPSSGRWSLKTFIRISS